MGPNGCSLRPPLSPNQQEVVRNFGGRNVTIYLVKEGTPLPPTLQILHEHSDHYSMQCTKPMTLDELNEELTKFFETSTSLSSTTSFQSLYYEGWYLRYARVGHQHTASRINDRLCGMATLNADMLHASIVQLR